MCVCVCVCACVCVCVCVHACVCVQASECLCMYIHIHMHHPLSCNFLRCLRMSRDVLPSIVLMLSFSHTGMSQDTKEIRGYPVMSQDPQDICRISWQCLEILSKSQDILGCPSPHAVGLYNPRILSIPHTPIVSWDTK